VSQLLAAPNAATIYAGLLEAEQTALADKKSPANPAAPVT
jgi:hypothetical protein